MKSLRRCKLCSHPSVREGDERYFVIICTSTIALFSESWECRRLKRDVRENVNCLDLFSTFISVLWSQKPRLHLLRSKRREGGSVTSVKVASSETSATFQQLTKMWKQRIAGFCCQAGSTISPLTKALNTSGMNQRMCLNIRCYWGLGQIKLSRDCGTSRRGLVARR